MRNSPKHFARELDVPVRAIRVLLRTRFGKPDKMYWTWNDKEAVKIRKWLAQSLGKEIVK
jgi:hypothetical protein